MTNLTRSEYNTKLEAEILKHFNLENIPIDIQEQIDGGAYIYSLKRKSGI